MSNNSNGSHFSLNRLSSFVIVSIVLAIGIAIGTLITFRAGANGPGDSQLKISTGGKPVAGGAALSLSQAFVEVTSTIESSVVNINTEEVVRVSSRRGIAPLNRTLVDSISSRTCSGCFKNPPVPRARADSGGLPQYRAASRQERPPLCRRPQEI